MVSIIVPALNEEVQIADTLRALQNLEGEKEILVVDGGSDDETVAIARKLKVAVLRVPPAVGFNSTPELSKHMGASSGSSTRMPCRRRMLWAQSSRP